MDVEVADNKRRPVAMESRKRKLKPGSAVIGQEPNCFTRFISNNKQGCHNRSVNYSLIPLLITVTISTYLNVAWANVDLALKDVDLPLPEPLPSPSSRVSKCEACRLFVDSFEKGMKATERGKHEGGDTSWEEKNLRSYHDSEVRLIEIQEKICEDVKTGKPQCLSLAEDSEYDVEAWWFEEKKKNVRLFDYLCINKLKLCCPNNKWGYRCQPCPDCAQHGTCDGEGTRLGTGKCLCDSGYIGEACQDCSDDHYRVDLSNQFACSPCDSTCEGCYGPGPTNCTECRTGFYKHETSGCIDIDECDDYTENRPCKTGTYCINTNGSYRCAGCHPACRNCVAYGANYCVSCSPGYKLVGDTTCRREEELEEDEMGQMELDSLTMGRMSPLFSRYFFYASCLAVSVMIFRSNLYVMYTFLFGFVIALALSEFKLLDQMQDYTNTSPD